MTDAGDDDATTPADEPVTGPATGSSGPRTLWRRIAGDGTHIGFWTLPVFIATALAGAVIAGSIANVYYAQQVTALEEETRAARTAADLAAEDIAAARQEALDAIDEQLAAVRGALEVARPLEDPATAGVVALTVELTPEPTSGPTPAGDAGADGAPLPAAASEQPTEPAATTQPAPIDDATPPPVPGAPTRAGVGFVVAVEGGEAFIATSYGVVADPLHRLGVAPAVTVTTPSGSVRGIVHAWDETRHLAIVRATLGNVAVLPWRPADVPIVAGDVAVLAAVTPSDVGLQLPGRVGLVTATALLTDLPLDPVFDGAPVLDAVGRVVGVQSSTAEPFGPGSSGIIAAPQLCVELITGCSLLEVADDGDPATEEN